MDGHEWRTALAELRYLDQESSAAYEEAVGAFPQDSDIARELHRFRADHARHAERIDDVFFGKGTGPGELPEEARMLLQEQVWRVTQARGRADELKTLLEAEQRHLERYEREARAQMPAKAAGVVRDGLAEERRHVDELRRLVAAIPGARG